MKTATIPTNQGEVIETTTRRTTRPAPDSENNARPEFWAYLRALDANPGEWEKHVIYFYRMDPGGPAGSGVPLGKFARMLLLPDGSQVPMSDQEEVELAIMKHFGGRSYRFIVKRGSERIADTRIYIEAQPRPIVMATDMPPASAGATVTSINGTDGSIGAIAGKAIDTIAGQDHQAVRIGIEALNSAANIVRSMGAGNSAPQDDLTRAMYAAMIQRLTAPPPDPLDLLTKLLALQAQLNPNNGGNPIVAQIMETGLKRLLDPPVVSGTGPVSAGAELVRSLPSVAGYVVDGLREWRIGMEAQRDGVAMMSQRAPGAPPPTVAPAAQVLPPKPAANPTPTAANGAPHVEPPPLEFIETRIVELLRAPVSAEEAADRALEFLYMMEGENPPVGRQYVTQLTSMGETGLLQLFQHRPILKPATSNTQRLLDFIRAFLKLHAEDAAEEKKEANEHKPN